MHLTPSFPEHKSSGLPRFPLNGPSAPRLSDKVVLAGSNNRIYCPTPAPSSLLHPEWHRMSRDPGSGSQGTAVLSKASDGRGRGEPSEPPRHPSRFCEPAGGRGTRGGNAREEGARGRGAGKPRWRPKLPFPRRRPGAHGGVRPPRGSRAALAKLKVKVPEAEEEERAARAGLCVQPGRAWGRAGTLATEPAAGEARAGSLRGKRSPPTCCLRAAFCEVWATPAAAGAGQIERSLQNWRAAGSAKLPARKVTRGYPLQICHVL